MKLTELDIYEIRKWFEDSLNRSQRIDKKTKMRMRRKIRDEIFQLLIWEKPNPQSTINRWEDKLFDVFLAMPFGFKDELLQLLNKKMLKTAK